MEKILISQADAAAALSISLRSLVKLIAAGQLAPTRRVGRRVLVPVATLKAFAKRDHVIPKGGRP